MTLPCYRFPCILAFVFAAFAHYVFAAEPRDLADLPAPMTAEAFPDPSSLDDLGEGPIKPRPYRWLVDDPLTPVSQSTIAQFATEVADVDLNNILERPGIQVGWFTELELTAANPRISSRQQSGNLLNATFADPIAPPFVPLNWTAMPKITIGYRRPEGIGELSASYRFLNSQGSDTIPRFNGAATGNGASGVTMHIVDLDYSLTDLFPNDLWLVPRQFRLTGGVRVADIRENTSASGGKILGQSATNTFIGAGPRFALESFYPISSHRWTLFTKIDTAGIIGPDRQSFSQSIVGPGGTITTASASSNPSVVALPVVGLRAGLNWLPDWGRGNVKMSAGYQWERWFYLGATTSSYTELTIQGPFLRGELAF